MERVRSLIEDVGYRELLDKICDYEKDRIFCPHNTEHLIDVARIAWILCLEEKVNLPRDIVYAAAFLHDLGRAVQYQNDKENHADAGACLAGPLLHKHGFTQEETEIIAAAIREHRLEASNCNTMLGRILARADRLSRICSHCSAAKHCYKVNNMPAKEGIVY